MHSLRVIRLVAGKEFQDCLQNRWLVCGAILFAVLSLAIVFGTAAVGGTLVFQPLASMMNSFLTLTVFLLPLLAMLISYDAFVGEAESGTLLLMLTYPMTRWEWLAGKLAGQGLALLLALSLGYGVLFGLQAGLDLPYGMAELASRIVPMVLSGWVLGLVFMLAGYAVSLTVDRKAKALGILFVIWFVIVLLYDLALLVLTVSSDGALGRESLGILLTVNPASAFRLFNQVLLGTAPAGAPSAGVLAGVAAGWLTLLFGGCTLIFYRRRL